MTATKARIRSAPELLAALRLTDIASRVTVLRGVAAEPDRALALGAHDGRDVVDELLCQASQRRGRTDWLAVVGALAAFRDKRVVAFFQRILATFEEPQILFTAARRLSHEPVESLHAFLTPLLQSGSIARARAVAGLLADSATLSAAERVRVSLLSDAEGFETAPLDAGTAACWLAELEGAFRTQAQERLEAQAEPAFAYLRGEWDALSDENREWLLVWGTQNWPALTGALLATALELGTDSVALAAMECLPTLGADAAPFLPSLARFARHPDPALRLAAIRAGATGMDWRAALRQETDPALRQACARCLAREEGAGGIAILVALLEDEDWAMRAAVAEALIDIGTPVVGVVKPLVHHTSQGVRTAAVQVLVALGEQAWLEQEMLA